MGKLLYGSPPVAFEFDDRALAHIELVTLAKLRRGEHFALSVETVEGEGRTTIWLGTDIPLQFQFELSRHEINRAWLEELLDSANSTTGLRLTPEKQAPEKPTPEKPTPKKT